MEEFYVLSQLAIATAGFAALASILKPKTEKWDSLSKLNLARFYIMIELSIVVAAFGFLPIILKGFLNENMTFRLSSGIIFMIGVFIYSYSNKRNKRLSGKVNIGGKHTVFMRVLAISSLLLALINTIGLFKLFYREIYLIVLYIFFLITLNLFYRLIIFSVGPNKK